MLLDKISVIWFENNEKYSLYFYYHFRFITYIFLFLESLKFDASSSKFDASQRGLSEAIRFFTYKLNFIANGYRRNLCMFKNHHKYFIKLGAVVCVRLFSERRKVNWNYFSFLIWTFTIKRKRKDGMSVGSCNSVNSAIMYNAEITIKMSFVITTLI